MGVRTWKADGLSYLPDITRYQQLLQGDPYGAFNCTAYAAAWITDAHTAGKTLLTGREVRAHTNEPVPDPNSPGLNLPQVDWSVIGLTGGKVNLDTRIWIPTPIAEALIVDGRWAVVQVLRGVLVDHGFLEGFRGGHAITVHTSADGIPIFGDPLVGHYIRGSWSSLWAAASALIHQPGRANVSLTRDLTPDYRVSVPAGSEFVLFNVTNNVITGSNELTTPGGVHQPCTPPRWYDWPGPRTGRRLAEITAGPRKGLFVHAKWTYEVQP